MHAVLEGLHVEGGCLNDIGEFGVIARGLDRLLSVSKLKPRGQLRYPRLHHMQNFGQAIPGPQYGVLPNGVLTNGDRHK